MTTANNTLERLLNEHDVARITGLSVATIRRRRLLQQPPKFIKLGAAVKYKPADLAAWIDSQPTGGGYNAETR
jgi:predicted DNA-binding transcriptional regulator AlpA